MPKVARSTEQTIIPKRDRGDGSIFQDRYRDKHGAVKTVATWSIRYSVHGARKKESGFRTRLAAKKMLDQRHAEIATGQYRPNVDATTYADLEALILQDYERNGQKSMRRVKLSCSHLKAFFGGMLARVIPDRVDGYVIQRRNDNAANATINRELSALRRMFRLGVKQKKVAHRVDDIDMLQENNVRKGFFERDRFDAICQYLPAPEQVVCDMAYITGWRVPTELLTRTWAPVDFTHGWLRLETGETKNDEGRSFPLTPDLRRILEAQRAHTPEVEKQTSTIVPWSFIATASPFDPCMAPGEARARRPGIPACTCTTSDVPPSGISNAQASHVRAP
jgi:integrase